MLLTIANHFYKADPSEYRLLRISVTLLDEHGIVVKYESPASVGDTASQTDTDGGALFPHIYGELPVAAVTKEYHIRRASDGTFMDILDFDAC